MRRTLDKKIEELKNNALKMNTSELTKIQNLLNLSTHP